MTSPSATDTDPSMLVQLEATDTKASLQFTITGFSAPNANDSIQTALQSIKKEFVKAGLDTSDVKARLGDMGQALDRYPRALDRYQSGFAIDRHIGIIPKVEAYMYVPGEDDDDEVVYAEAYLENTDCEADAEEVEAEEV